MNILLEVNIHGRIGQDAGTSRKKTGAAEAAGDQRVKALRTLLQLRFVNGSVDAKVVEEREGYRAGDGNAVLGIGGKVRIAANGGNAIDRNRNLFTQAQLRLVWICGTQLPSGFVN